MNPNQDLETQLRASLITRAQDITHVSQWAPPAAVPPTPGWRSPRVWAPLAAAACVGALVAGILIGRSDDKDHSAVQPTPTPTPSVTAPPSPTGSLSTSTPPSPTSSAPVRQQTVPLACSTTLPATWKTALSNSVVDSGSSSPATATISPVGVAADGSVIAYRDDGPFPGYGREVVLLTPGKAAETLYSLPDPDRYSVNSADIAGNWLVVGVQNQGREPKGTIGGNTPDVIDAVIAVNLATHQSRVIVSSPDYLKPNAQPDTGIAITNDAVFEGKVYWDERASYSATKGAVKYYDLTSGATGTLASNTPDGVGSGYLVAAVGGLVLNPQFGGRTLLIPSELPQPVATVMTDFTRAHVATDGSTYAWAVDPTTIGWWRPGQAAPKYLRIPGGFDTDDGGGTPIVAGNFVLTFQATEVVTDMLTGVSAPITDASYLPNTRGGLDFGSQGYLIGDAFGTIKAHYVNGYWLDTPLVVLRINTVSLPKLSC